MELVREFGFQGFNYEDDAVEYLEDMLKTDFPYGYKDMPEKIKLYRVLFLKNPNKYKKSDFGYHYAPNKIVIDDAFLMRIGGESFDWDETPPYIFEVLIDRESINFNSTLLQNMAFPYEYEITTKTSSPVIKVLNIEKY